VAVDNFVRLSGTFLLIGGSLATLGWLSLFTVFNPQNPPIENPIWIFGNLAVIFGGIFMSMGLPGFYLTLAGRAGWLGLLAFIFLFIGLAIPYIAVQTIETTTMPDVPARIMWFISIGAPSLFTGSLLMGITIIRTDIFPTWLGIAVIISVLLGLLTRLIPMPPFFYRAIIPSVFTLVIAVVGYMLILIRK
jgi:hypothetical protein